jgi:hypothetical protein
MEEIFYFQFSKEVYVRLSTVQAITAAKWHILSYRYDICA